MAFGRPLGVPHSTYELYELVFTKLLLLMFCRKLWAGLALIYFIFDIKLMTRQDGTMLQNLLNARSNTTKKARSGYH